MSYPAGTIPRNRFSPSLEKTARFTTMGGATLQRATRRIVIITSLGKRYEGNIDLPSLNFRTSDLLNSSTVYWKQPSRKYLENSIMLSNVNLSFNGNKEYRKFDLIQIRIPEIVVFFDSLGISGYHCEKMRAANLQLGSSDSARNVHIITSKISNSFYTVSGTIHGAARQKMNRLFVPVSDAVIAEVRLDESSDFKENPVDLPNSFLGINTRYIEALSEEPGFLTAG
jgi:hypothetical protein